MVDVFQEVDEQVRSDRYRAFALRAWPWALGVVVTLIVIVAVIWGVERYRDLNAQKASQAYDQGLNTLRRGDPVAAFDQFAIAVASSDKAYAALALMQQAGVRLDQHRTPEAVALLDKSAKIAPDLVIGDAARLKAALALLDTAAYSELEARLKPLTEAQHPYKAAAREALAMAKLNAGRLADARTDFVILPLLPDATDDMRQRAQAAVALIDSGSAAGLRSIVKAGLVLPPPSPATSTSADQPNQAGAAQ